MNFTGWALCPNSSNPAHYRRHRLTFFLRPRVDPVAERDHDGEAEAPIFEQADLIPHGRTSRHAVNSAGANSIHYSDSRGKLGKPHYSETTRQ
jgi:hypothetical protein